MKLHLLWCLGLSKLLKRLGAGLMAKINCQKLFLVSNFLMDVNVSLKIQKLLLDLSAMYGQGFFLREAFLGLINFYDFPIFLLRNLAKRRSLYKI